jgi:release factor glutamine methyltransferase
MQHGPSEVATIRNLLADAAASLVEGPHAERARRDAEALLLRVMRDDAPDVNLAWLIAHEYETLPARETAAFRAWVERRRAGEPIQYITGEAEFYGLSFKVNRAVLIPRPETEHLVEKVIEIAGGPEKLSIAKQHIAKLRIADVGTGSGAIAVALASKLSAARVATRVHATEISAAALAVARGNAVRNGVADRVVFHKGDLLAPVAGKLFDFVVSNPPYVPERDRDSLSVEVRDYEPEQALFAGSDGLAVYRRLIPAAFNALFHDRYLVLEIGFGQQEAVGELMADARFEDIEFTKDLQGIARVAVARRP